jgi:hypothetical protein
MTVSTLRILKHRWLIVVLALVAASAFALSVQGRRWWSIGDVTVGPFGAHSPFGGAGDLSWTGGSVRWERFAIATGAGGLIAMFVLVMLGAGVAARRVPLLVAKTALAAIVTAGVAAIGFVVARPAELPFRIDRGIALFVVAVVTGVIAAVSVLRAQHSEPEPGTDTADERASG